MASEDVSERVDKLNELPDSVLCHVLSFLPTMDEVVRTSILSKRWKDLWTYVDTLEFMELLDPEKMQFSQFVNRVLHCHRGSIKKMKIFSLYDTASDNDIRNWTTIAIDRGVKILDIILFGGLKFRWPFCLFHSQTLVELRLGGVDFTNLNIPSAPFFPSLKELGIRYSEFDFRTLHLLISGCSVLEDLSISMDFFYKIPLNLSSSTLKRLVLSFTLKRLVVDYLLEMIDFYPKIELDVPALEFLYVKGYLAEFCVKSQLSSLSEVYINISSNEKDVNEDICCHSLIRLMEQISNVKVLQLELDFKKPLTYAMNAKFPNLTKLRIVSSLSECPLLRSYMESSINFEFITLEGSRRITKKNM